VWRQEVRTVREVPRGEELTVCYRSFWPNSRTERQELMKHYNFDCCCEGCDVTKELEEKEAYYCEKFTKANKKRLELKQKDRSLKEDLDLEVVYLKEMLRLSKEIPTISLKNVLSIIAEEGYAACCQRLLRCKQACGPGEGGLQGSVLEHPGLLDWQFEEMDEFLTLGLQLSSLLHGKDHSLTRLWRQRREQPIKCFINDQV